MPLPASRCRRPLSWAPAPPGVGAAVGAVSTRSLRESCPLPSPGRPLRTTAPWSTRARGAAPAPWSSCRGPGEYAGPDARLAPCLSLPALCRGTQVAPTFPGPSGSLSFWPEFQTPRARESGRVPRERVFTRVCIRPALAEQKHHGLAVSGSGVRSCGSPLKSGAKPVASRRSRTCRNRPGRDSETRSPPLQERPGGAQSRAVSPTRGSAAFVSPNLSQARGESLLRNSYLRSGIPVSQENLAFFFYFLQIL